MTSGRPVSEAEFAAMNRNFLWTSCRAENQFGYAIDEEAEEFQRFLAGTPRPPTEVGWWAEYLDGVRELAQRPPGNRHIARVRLIPDDGPTDYQRWLIWADPWYKDAGMDICYIGASLAEVIGFPTDTDWQLFDQEQLVIMPFSDAGQIAPKTLITDPETVRGYAAAWNTAVAHATPATLIKNVA